MEPDLTGIDAANPGASAPAPSAPSTPPASPSTPPPGTTTQTVSAPATPAPAPATPPAPATFRDRARASGLDLTGQNFSDDAAAEAWTFEQLRQRNEYATFGQQVAPHYQEFLAYLNQRSNPTPQPGPVHPAPADQPQGNPFGLPAYDPSWLSQVMRDAEGNIVPRPGQPPDVPAKLMAYTNALQQAQHKFYGDPAGVLAPIVQAIVQPILQEHVAGQLSQVQDSYQADQFIQQNAGWLHAKDGSGRALMNPVTGKPQLTAAGNHFLRNLEYAQNAMGIPTQAGQIQYAMLATQMAMAGQAPTQSAPTAPANPLAAANADFLNRNAGYRPQPSGQTAPATDPNNPPPINGHMDLAERIRRNLLAGGVTDQQLLLNGV